MSMTLKGKLTPEQIESVLRELRKAMEDGTTFLEVIPSRDIVEVETAYSAFRTQKPGQWHQHWKIKIDGPLVMR